MGTAFCRAVVQGVVVAWKEYPSQVGHRWSDFLRFVESKESKSQATPSFGQQQVHMIQGRPMAMTTPTWCSGAAAGHWGRAELRDLARWCWCACPFLR
jgi:hypothetical protein